MIHIHTPETIANTVVFLTIKELGKPKHVAAMVASLLRSDAAYMTGAVIATDGGFTT